MKRIIKYFPKPVRNLWLNYYTHKYRQALSGKTVEQVFDHIYQKRIWGKVGNESGSGSTKARTAVIRQSLQELLQKYDIQAILDLPCGDFNWMSEMNLDGINYLGADIVKDLIQLNTSNHERDHIKFTQLDIICDPLPAADLLLCRDCYVHLSLENIERSLQNIRRSDIKYLLLTTFPETTENQDILTGEWRRLNMELPPFNLKPIDFIHEKHPDHNGLMSDKSLMLVKMSDGSD